MNKLLCEAILDITLQKDSEALQRAYLSALMMLYSLHESVIYRVINNGVTLTLEQIIKLERAKNNPDSAGNYIDDVPKTIAPEADVNQCISSKSLLVRQGSGNEIIIYMPIMIVDSVVAVVSLSANVVVLDSLEEIRYLALIYENLFGLIDESERDKLTGLYNRRTFDAKLEKMLATQKTVRQAASSNEVGLEKRDSETGEKAWLVALDIDFFKRVNDEYGHVAGDEVLLRLSQIMKECFRHTDLLFRFGGEEFIIVLEPIPFDKVWAALERFRKAVVDHNFPLVGTVTVSIGFAGIKEHDYPVTILDYADKALYYGKGHGRNCIHSYEQLLELGRLASPEVSGDIDLF